MCSPRWWTPASHSSSNAAATGRGLIPEIFHPWPTTLMCQHIFVTQNSPGKISLPLSGPPGCQDIGMSGETSELNAKSHVFCIHPAVLHVQLLRCYNWSIISKVCVHVPYKVLDRQGQRQGLLLQTQTDCMSHQGHTRKGCGTMGAGTACSSISASMLRREVSAE